jgi:hypothetical protein
MSLVCNECPRAIYTALANRYIEDKGGLNLQELCARLTKYSETKIATSLGQMLIVGVVKDDSMRRDVYRIGNQTEWSALFARELGYNPEELGIPAIVANI